MMSTPKKLNHPLLNDLTTSTFIVAMMTMMSISKKTKSPVVKWFNNEHFYSDNDDNDVNTEKNEIARC
jgi:hypothetical protein